MRKQYALSQQAYANRAAAVARIPHFWPLVIEQAPPEIDQFVHPSDSAIFANHLTSLTVTRPELEENPESGNPRSLKFRFEFRENSYFEDEVLEKIFWHRRARDGWTGLVSEPVRIRWKGGKDLTEGLTDAAVDLWEARRKVTGGDMRAKGMNEYRVLEEKVEHWNGANTSIFTWFGFVSARRWVGEEEDKEARARRRGAGREKDGEVEEEEEEDEDNDDQRVEVHEAGEEIAIGLADDLWPNATRFFTQAMGQEEDLSDVDFEEGEEEDEDEDDEEGKPVDIQSLIRDESGGKGRKTSNGEEGPPSKKIKR